MLYQPNLFTVVFMHPEADPVVAVGVHMKQLFGVIFSARPVRSVFIFPCQMRDENRCASQIADRAVRCVVAERQTDDGGFTAAFNSTEPEAEPAWARHIVHSLDDSIRQNRVLAREHRMAEARRRYLAHAAAAADRKAHADAPEMYTLEQRARLQGA